MPVTQVSGAQIKDTDITALDIANGAVTLAKMANLPANTIIGNNTGSPSVPLALTVAQAQTLLGIGAGGGDISGTGVVGRVAEFVTTTKTIQAAKIIGPAANIITITNAAAATLALILWLPELLPLHRLVLTTLPFQPPAPPRYSESIKPGLRVKPGIFLTSPMLLVLFTRCFRLPSLRRIQTLQLR